MYSVFVFRQGHWRFHDDYDDYFQACVIARGLSQEEAVAALVSSVPEDGILYECDMAVCYEWINYDSILNVLESDQLNWKTYGF